MRSVVLIHGLLRGMGREAKCQMLAIRESVADMPPVYLHCSVMDAPADMPDGDYTVSFYGHTVQVRREGGLWLARDWPPGRRGPEAPADPRGRAIHPDAV